MDKIVYIEADRPPLCPHCERKLTEIHWHKIKKALKLGYVAVHSCPHCNKVLGVTASTG